MLPETLAQLSGDGYGYKQETARNNLSEITPVARFWTTLNKMEANMKYIKVCVSRLHKILSLLKSSQFKIKQNNCFAKTHHESQFSLN